MLLKTQLIENLSAACKEPKDWKIGCEHEVFLFSADNQRLVYDGPSGIQTVLQNFKDEYWDFVYESEYIIGLFNSVTGQAISLEPGGQLEFADKPQKNLHDVFNAHSLYWEKLDRIALKLNIFPKYQGLDGTTPIEQVPWMPKGRYAIMKQHMNKVGTRGLWMMTKTCTVQASLDFSSEADMVKKFQVSMALQPIISALFSNSSFNENGKEFQCYRTYIWQNTDQARCGILPFVFEPDFGFEKYVDYVLSVPMYFVKRKQYLDFSGANFQDFMKGRLLGYEGEFANLSDWEDQLTIFFPEVRLKYYLEQRGADCGSRAFIMALPALWIGLLYDNDNLQQLSNMIKKWTTEEIINLYNEIPEQGLDSNIQGQKISAIGKWLIELAEKGLKERRVFNHIMDDETIYLGALKEKYF